MGHYHAEMHTDNKMSEQEKAYYKRREQLEKKLCKLLDCKPKELKIVQDILQESWKK